MNGHSSYLELNLSAHLHADGYLGDFVSQQNIEEAGDSLTPAVNPYTITPCGVYSVIKGSASSKACSRAQTSASACYPEAGSPAEAAGLQGLLA